MAVLVSSVCVTGMRARNSGRRGVRLRRLGESGGVRGMRLGSACGGARTSHAEAATAG